MCTRLELIAWIKRDIQEMDESVSEKHTCSEATSGWSPLTPIILQFDATFDEESAKIVSSVVISDEIGKILETEIKCHSNVPLLLR